MRIARVMGRVTLNHREESLAAGSLLICETLESTALVDPSRRVPRKLDMPESMIVYDQFGAGPGSIIAVSESGEAARPFMPRLVPVDAYCAAILDAVSVDERWVRPDAVTARRPDPPPQSPK